MCRCAQGNGECVGQKDILVFVYGTLKQYQCRGSVLNHDAEKKGVKFLGKHVTDPKYSLYDLGSFPALVLGGETAIHGEVYKVTPNVMKILDGIEGYPHFYGRVTIPTPYGDAWVYTLDKDKVSGTLLHGGAWYESDVR